MVLGGTWRTPVAVGLQQKTFITDQKKKELIMKLHLKENMNQSGLELQKMLSLMQFLQ